MEGSIKRLKLDFAVQSFQNFKINAFIDYMMQATEEEKEFWATYFSRKSHHTGFTWQWIRQDHCIVLHHKNLPPSWYLFSRLSTGEDVREEIIASPWLLKEHADLYQNANATFWILITKQLDRVDDVKSLSLVSKLLSQVMRKDIVYKKWIDDLFKRDSFHKFYCNPCPFDMPLWKQFLFLSGQISCRLFEQLVNLDAKWFFFLMVSKGGWGSLPIPPNCVFDEENFKIYTDSKKKCLIEKVKEGEYINHDSVYKKPEKVYFVGSQFLLKSNMERYGM